MNTNDRFQLQRAREAERYIRSAEYEHLVQQDIARQKELDRAAGHLPECGLLKCHPDCPTLRGE